MTKYATTGEATVSVLMLDSVNHDGSKYKIGAGWIRDMRRILCLLPKSAIAVPSAML